MSTPSDNRDPAIAGGRSLLRIVKGDPTPEELAALVAVVAGRRAGPAGPAPTRRPVWGHPAYAVRREHRAGPGAWLASARPRH